MRLLGIVSALAFVPIAMAGCNSEPDDTKDPDNTTIQWITCAQTSDCVSRGGSCVDSKCRADNECASNADCALGQCVADTNFGGLCTTVTEGPPLPEPPWPCTAGSDCPIGQGCGSDSLCHEDGECNADSDCGTDELCYSAGNDSSAGICAADRPATDPYCRSDGAGACRYECNVDGTCPGGTCTAGLCYGDDECTTAADCTPNHLCEPWDDYGYSRCVDDPDPPCIDDGAGACRYACVTNSDCHMGGGCDTDGFCHASNECTTVSDCDPGLLCYADEHFGGLCGPERPE